jgi:hypothetical protein
MSGFYLQGGGAGGKLLPQSTQLPPKRKEKEEKKREREREGEREGGRERRSGNVYYLGDMIIHDTVNNIRRIYYVTPKNHKMY